MKNIIIVIIILIVFVFWGISEFNDKRTEAKAQKIKLKERVGIANNVSVIIDKYNAVTDWEKNFKGRLSLLSPVYTIEIQDALVRSDGRPILFFASVEDIVRKGDKFFIHFSNFMGSMSSVDIHFILECTQEQVTQARFESPNLFENFAVVSQIDHVGKVPLLLEAKADSLGPEEIDVTIGNRPSNVFVAKGNCNDLIFVGDFDSDDLLDGEKENE